MNQSEDSDNQPSLPEPRITQQANDSRFSGGQQAAIGQGNIQIQGDNNWLGNTYIHLGQQTTASGNSVQSQNKRQRTQQERESLDQAYTLQSQKVAKIRIALVIETDPSRKFQYEQQIKNEETELKRLTDRLDEIEEQLQSAQSIPAISEPKSIQQKNMIVNGQHQEKLLNWSKEDSINFVADRFAKAFPGSRGLEVFESSTEAVKRLAILLEEPLVFQHLSPFWWVRGLENCQISNFKILNDGIVILNNFQELKINKIAVFRSVANDHCFVYVETEPMEPIGLYSYSVERIQNGQKKLEYFSEEFGIYEGKHFITRAEYDDRACIINKEIIDLENSKTELRFRYLTPYNLVICGNYSSIIHPLFDSTREKTLDQILNGSSNIELLVKQVTALPRVKRI
ncbi:hypothetical protein [Nostoc sp. FACHB-888]|uniref:hypothetical protein n=1 Tax=Nostoc sp. FACHB-888 TaxID=2692842 RepID=UPI001688973D|nr:hypothetical protein [Nostoc sp. FACHB-888]MBD2249081.1 hypothetical protein [Nostoc sp. FACHB-888]